jgi:signal transduction histidine kinase/DNA-binding response OmpR family regulator
MASSATDSASALPEMTPQAQRLRSLIRFNEPGAPIGAPAVLLMWWFYRTPSTLIIAGLVAFTIVIQRFAIHYTERNQVQKGIMALSIAIWLPALGMAVLAPDVWAITVVFTVLSVLLALPYVDSRGVLRLISVACLILAIGAYFRTFPIATAFPPDISPYILGAIIAVGSGVGAVLCMFSVWQSNDRLLETVHETQEANQALRESERTLEQRVERRTADLEESQRELALARDEALAANRAKSSFLANMSHELRTPLNAIIGYSELMKEEAQDGGQHGFVPDLDRILGSGKHLLGLINDVLDLSKVEAGRMELVTEDFEIEALVGDVAATVQPLVARRSNTLEVGDLAGTGSMHSDPTKLRQVLLNLLSNAAKFTENGTIGLRVARSQEDGADWLEFSVSDEGIGMTPEQLESVFDAFSQADKTTQRDYGGTGLGLAISRRFCQLLGGEVSVTSELGAGTEFHVRLPATVPELEQVQAPAEAAAGATEIVEGEAGGPTVLVIDDEAEARDLLMRHLSKDGCRVVTTGTGKEGLALARELQPDFITLDVRMPGMDGWQVLSELKADAQLDHIPVILVTILEDRNLGFALGASEYVTKPVSRERLSELLQRYGSRSAPVLVVEDHADTRELIRRTLEQEGVAAVLAENGRIALERLESCQPALILLDLLMPEMDGFELLQALREREAWSGIPVVVVTAKDLTREEREALAGRTDQVIEKGAYGREQLLAEVRRHVRSAVGPALGG